MFIKFEYGGSTTLLATVNIDDVVMKVVYLTRRVPAGLAVMDDDGIHLFDSNYAFSKVRWGCGSGLVGVRITSVLWI